MPVDAPTLKAWLSDDREIALLDVREHGQYGIGHLFFAVPLPYSRFELGLSGLVPNRSVRLVLCDDGDGVAARAAARAAALGYTNVSVLEGGAPAWRAAGYTLYDGVNVPSKVFGELIEHARHTPRISAQDLEVMRERGDNFVIVDGRPWAEYRKMSIPGGICCPNGELVLRIRGIAPDPSTRIVVNCAGRTRSIIGAQTLIDFGIPNPVCALENGTQGWFLAGLELARNADRRYGDARCRECRECGAAVAGAAFRDGVRGAFHRTVRGPGMARRCDANDLSFRHPHRRGVCRRRPSGLRPRAGRPARPGDRPMGRRAGRTHRALRPRSGARAGDRRLAAPARA